MRKSALIAGITALACAGGVYAAAQSVHVLKVAMPDGSIAQIHYVGDVAPKIVLAPAEQNVAMIDPDFDAPFAMFDRMAAEMDRQQAAMLAQVAASQGQSQSGARLPTSGGAPAQPGVYHYTYVATSNGPGGCTQSYELTSYGEKQQPKEVSQQSGDCRGVAPLVKASVPAVPSALATPTPAVVKAREPARISPDSI